MRQNKPFFLGLTGGVGCGKSMILRILKERYDAEVIEADRLAEELCLPGTDLYREIREAFPEDILYTKDCRMDRAAFSKLVFSEKKKRNQLNQLVHPAVKRYIINRLETLRKTGEKEIFVLEAALLFEDGYDRICDEIWTVSSGEAAKRERLKSSRGYSDERIDAVLRSQHPDEWYRERADAVIENNGSKEDAAVSVEKCVRERIYERETD